MFNGRLFNTLAGYLPTSGSDDPLCVMCQEQGDTPTNNMAAATFFPRLKGKPTPINVAQPQDLTTDLPATKSVTAGPALFLSVEAAGGVTPYTHHFSAQLV